MAKLTKRNFVRFWIFSILLVLAFSAAYKATSAQTGVIKNPISTALSPSTQRIILSRTELNTLLNPPAIPLPSALKPLTVELLGRGLYLLLVVCGQTHVQLMQQSIHNVTVFAIGHIRSGHYSSC